LSAFLKTSLVSKRHFPSVQLLRIELCALYARVRFGPPFYVSFKKSKCPLLLLLLLPLRAPHIS